MITEIGNSVIWYRHNGREIAWNGKGYSSMDIPGNFDTLKDLDDAWEEYAIVSNYVSFSDAE